MSRGLGAPAKARARYRDEAMPGWRLIVLACLALLMEACASQSPRIYTGTITRPPNKPAVGQSVSASRPAPGFWASFVGANDLDLGTTTTDANGRFRLQASGKAALLLTDPTNPCFFGFRRLSGRERGDIDIVMKPALAGIGRSPDFRQKFRELWAMTLDEKVATAALETIVSYLIAHPNEPIGSLHDYASKGVISPDALAAFERDPRVFLGSNPLVRFHWGRIDEEGTISLADGLSPISLKGRCALSELHLGDAGGP